MAAKKRPQKTKKQKKEEQAYWRAEFWRLYDPEKVVIGRVFKERLEDEKYYSALTFKHQCFILKWYYDNMNAYGVNKARLRDGNQIRMWSDDGTGYYYVATFGKVKREYGLTGVSQHDLDKVVIN